MGGDYKEKGMSVHTHMHGEAKIFPLSLICNKQLSSFKFFAPSDSPKPQLLILIPTSKKKNKNQEPVHMDSQKP